MSYMEALEREEQRRHAEAAELKSLRISDAQLKARVAELETELRVSAEPDCPFCGSQACEVTELDETDVAVVCCDCQAQGPATRVGCRDDEAIDLEAEAIGLWNERKRTRSQSDSAELAELKAALEPVRAAIFELAGGVNFVRGDTDTTDADWGRLALRLGWGSVEVKT
jgi:hypothetical protein